MTFGVYAMYDSLSGYAAPTVEINDAIALRNFEHAVLRGGSLMDSHPEHFALHRIGSYDNETGLISPLSAPSPIVTASQVVLRSLAAKNDKEV